jgi:sulfur carrier protein
MAAKLILRGKEREVRSGMTLRDALLKLDVQPEAVLAIRQGEMITDDEILKEGDEIKLVMVISGGSA